jgi:hypothetical protein
MLRVRWLGLSPRVLRTSLVWGSLFLGIALGGCAHPAERALKGRWLGEAVENFNQDELAEATAWARGTMLEFKSSSITVAIPAEESRTGTYVLGSVSDRNVKLRILDLDGQESDMELVVDDEDHLRWLLGDGRSVVMKREDAL